MAAIRITKFGGLLPSSDKSMIPDNAAQTAINCRLTSGTLDAYKTSVQVRNPGTSAIKTIYRFDQASLDDTNYWFTFNTDVNVVKGAVAGDVQERTYWTGDGYPKVTDTSLATTAAPYPSNSYRLGTPAPSSAALAVAVAAAIPSATALTETRVYTYTYVTAWGEESPPCAASLPVDVKSDGSVNLSALSTSPGGNYNVTHKRIYRTSTGATSTNYLYVAEIPLAQTTFSDTVATTDLGEVLPTLGSALLPDTAKGLTSMANGILAAFLEYDVYFSESYKPYSWPTTNMQAVDYPVVGIGAFGTSLVVLTTGNPYVMTGTDPQSISVEKLAMPYSCVSKRSICNAFGNVVYAAPDGLVSIGVNGTTVMTEQLMTRLEWQTYNPSSMLCAVWDDRVFMFYDTGTKQGCLTLDGKQGLVETDIFATAVYNDTVTGSLYLAVADKIVKWNAGSPLTYKWKSKQFTHPNFVNFAWGQALATSYPLTMRTYADNVLRSTTTVTSAAAFRLPSGFKSRYWEIELEGTTPILTVVVAEAMEELKSV